MEVLVFAFLCLLFVWLRLQLSVETPGVLQHSFVDMRNIEELREACRPDTKLFWLETPTNPLIEVVDIRPVAECARSQKVLLACENTFATPVLQRPLELGADLVVHALTKYLSGHSDVLGGAVIFGQKSELASRIKVFQRVGGAVKAIEIAPQRLALRSSQPPASAGGTLGHCTELAARYAAWELSDNPGVPATEVAAGRLTAEKSARRTGGR